MHSDTQSTEARYTKMTERARIVAHNLQVDIDLLVDSLKSLEGAVGQLNERFPADHLQIHVSESFALWAHYRFGGDWGAFVDFADESLKNWHREKSQMWVWEGPESEMPEPDAQRHLDRVYMGLEFIARELNRAAPDASKSHSRPREHAERLQAYARAANDVLNPTMA